MLTVLIIFLARGEKSIILKGERLRGGLS